MHPSPSYTWNTSLAGIRVGIFIMDPFSHVSPGSGIDTQTHKLWHASKAHWRLCSLNALRVQPTDQLSVHLHGCHRTIADQQHCHIRHIHPHTCPPHTSLGSHSFIPIPTSLPMTQVAVTIASTAQHNIPQPTTRITKFLHHATTLSTSSFNFVLSYIAATGGGVL